MPISIDINSRRSQSGLESREMSLRKFGALPLQKSIIKSDSFALDKKRLFTLGDLARQIQLVKLRIISTRQIYDAHNLNSLRPLHKNPKWPWVEMRNRPRNWKLKLQSARQKLPAQIMLVVKKTQMRGCKTVFSPPRHVAIQTLIVNKGNDINSHKIYNPIYVIKQR